MAKVGKEVAIKFTPTTIILFIVLLVILVVLVIITLMPGGVRGLLGI